MITVALADIEFFAYHGFYPEEQVLGTHFFVDISVSFVSAKAFDDDKIGNTVNYETLYNLIKVEMEHPRKLIETVVQAIIDKTVAEFPFIDSVKVTLKKMHPALGGPVKHSAVTLSYHNNQN